MGGLLQVSATAEDILAHFVWAHNTTRGGARSCRLCLNGNRTAEVDGTDGSPANEQATIGTVAADVVFSVELGDSSCRR